MKNNKVFAVSMTALWCAVFVSAMHSWPVGICMGFLMGTVFGLFDSGEEKKEEIGKKEDES